MTTEEVLIEEVRRAFAKAKHPHTLTRNPHHCSECEEHEDTLQGVDPSTISLEEVGNPGWDPDLLLLH